MSIAGVFGAIIGSFLNVVIHRVPNEESIVFPNSRCPSCGAVIAFYDNIPVLSYVLLGAKCRKCKEHISFRYPAVELLTAALFVGVAWHDELSAALPFDLVFASALARARLHRRRTHDSSERDHVSGDRVRHRRARRYSFINRHATLRRRTVAFTRRARRHAAVGVSLAGALIGALIGGGSLWLMGWTWEKLRGIEAMGLGDVKMMFMVGAYLGWRLTILTIFVGVLSGSVIGILLMAGRASETCRCCFPSVSFSGSARSPHCSSARR